MGMVAILFNGAEQFEQIDNIPLKESPMLNLLNIAQMVSEKKTFKNYTFLCFYHVWAWRPSCSMARNHLKKFKISF